MKKLQRWFSRRGALPLTCYLLALVLWLAQGAVHAGGDALARSAGTMYEADIPVSDWQLAGLTQTAATPETAVLEDSVTLTTTDGDPQMILEDVSGMTVRTLSYTVEFDGDARGDVPVLHHQSGGTVQPGTAGSFPRRWGAGAISTRCPAPPSWRCGWTPAAPTPTRPWG